jgi:hypothetical protein
LPEEFASVLDKWRNYIQYVPIEVKDDDLSKDKETQKLLNLKK